MATRITFLSGQDTLVTENEAEVVAAAAATTPTRSSSRAPTAWCSSSTGATWRWSRRRSIRRRRS